MIGLERGKIELHPHSPTWAEAFREEQNRLLEKPGFKAFGIEHIGSTAVPGLLAKPIIDIAISIRGHGYKFVADLEELGYLYKGENGIAGRHYFRTNADIVRHHIHMFPVRHEKLLDHLLFRDFLRAHPDWVQEYSRLKLSLQRQYPHDRKSYTEGKAKFIERVLGKAHQEIFE